jgi:arabinofuranosyltransferase
MPGRRLLIVLGAAFFVVVLLRTAWLSELSYLTLRTIEHAALGYGLRWNISERVQVFDHPLWAVLLLAGRMITGELYYTTFIVSVVLSTAAVVTLLCAATSLQGILLATAVLSLSWAFVSFSTSGLEGPLSHLLVIWFCAEVLTGPALSARRSPALLAGLAALAHPSTLLVTLPVLLTSRAKRRVQDEAGGTEEQDRDHAASHRTRSLLVFGPLFTWCTFATFYYGTPVPNPVIAEWTEHASLVSRLSAVLHGIEHVLRFDTLSLGIVAIAPAIAWKRGREQRAMASGALLYALVLALWAGDPLGRWLALPVAMATLLAVRHPALERPRVFGAAMTATIALAGIAGFIPLQSDVRFGSMAQQGFAGDRRGADYPATGLLHDIRQWYPPRHPEAKRGGVAWQDETRVKSSPNAAFFGFAAGYGVHVVDRAGRCDPLLARLRSDRVAAFPAPCQRAIPAGYEASLPDRENAIVDPALAAYYDRVRLVTRGPLADPRRMIAALRLALESAPQPDASTARSGMGAGFAAAAGEHAFGAYTARCGSAPARPHE